MRIYEAKTSSCSWKRVQIAYVRMRIKLNIRFLKQTMPSFFLHVSPGSMAWQAFSLEARGKMSLPLGIQKADF